MWQACVCVSQTFFPLCRWRCGVTREKERKPLRLGEKKCFFFCFVEGNGCCWCEKKKREEEVFGVCRRTMIGVKSISHCFFFFLLRISFFAPPLSSPWWTWRRKRKEKGRKKTFYCHCPVARDKGKGGWEKSELERSLLFPVYNCRLSLLDWRHFRLWPRWDAIWNASHAAHLDFPKRIFLLIWNLFSAVEQFLCGGWNIPTQMYQAV